MKTLANMPASGVIVIAVIAVLFILAVMLLFYVRLRYRFLEGKASGSDPAQRERGFRAALLSEYTAAYRQYGQDVNTPAIISDVVGSRLAPTDAADGRAVVIEAASTVANYGYYVRETDAGARR